MGEVLIVIAVIAAALVAGILIYAATKPDGFEVARSVRIKAAPEKIFPLIDFNTWNPFMKKDPAVKLAYSGPASGTGAAQEWEGNSSVGKGRVEITGSSPSSRIAMKLDMLSPMEGHNVVEFSLKPDGDATTVTWAMSGRCHYNTSQR
jgi:Polyketide cyclase / dehydrase and lipid transport